MKECQVVIIGGGATGVGIFRDLSMRGVKTILVEQGGLVHGTSSRFHGLLHSGARYAVADQESARECIEENRILRVIGRHCVEETEGFFVLTPEDPADFVTPWVAACARAGIEAQQLDVAEARRLEPNLAPDVKTVYRVPDSCVDGFRLVWHNAMAARRYGSEFYTYHRVVGIDVASARVKGVRVLNTITREEENIACDFVVNATGSWSGEVARMTGLDVQVSPDRGTLIVFNHRFTSRVINRLRKSSDGDIVVPHGSVTILGTTSSPADSPQDTRPTSDEVVRLLAHGKPLFPNIEHYRILRAFAGTRPLYTPSAGGAGRSASRNFHIVDHKEEGLQGFASIFGGKLTTYRLMAEKMSDLVCAHLGITAPCTTATVPLVDWNDYEKARLPALKEQCRRVFPMQDTRRLEDRLGLAFGQVVEAAAAAPKNQLLCECEMVSMAEVDFVARDSASHSLTDVRLRTRLGMGTCQGIFCSLRAVGAMTEGRVPLALKPADNVRAFLRERWKGLRPALWGAQLKELELGRAIYAASLNLDGNLWDLAATSDAHGCDTHSTQVTKECGEGHGKS